MNGKLIVIEGLDGSGKTTQFEMLKKRFDGCKFITFPNYGSPSGEIINQYLRGEFKEQNPVAAAYSASSFYAVDRYASYKSDWERKYKAGKTIISARYTPSNAMYQMTKLPKSIWKEYIDWLYDYEYKKLGIPIPDRIIFLDVPVEVSQWLLMERYGGDKAKMDIHESDVAFLKSCSDAAEYTMKNDACTKWDVIKCCENGQLRNAQLINDEIYGIVNGIV